MPAKNQQPGCLVRGKLTGITGIRAVKQLVITPEKTAIYAGIVFSAEPQLVPVADNGTFEVRLPPGRYQFKIDATTFTAVVPVGVTTIRFTEIVIYD